MCCEGEACLRLAGYGAAMPQVRLALDATQHVPATRRRSVARGAAGRRTALDRRLLPAGDGAQLCARPRHQPTRPLGWHIDGARPSASDILNQAQAESGAGRADEDPLARTNRTGASGESLALPPSSSRRRCSRATIAWTTLFHLRRIESFNGEYSMRLMHDGALRSHVVCYL